MDFSALGEKFGKARISAGLTQQELALRADVAEATVGHIETAKRHTSVETLEKVAAAMGARLILDVVAGDTAARTSVADADHAAILVRLSALLSRLPTHRIDTLLEDIALWESKYPPDTDK